METRPGALKRVDSPRVVAYYSSALGRFPSKAGSLKSSHESERARNGRVPEWLKGTGCKPVGYAYLGSNPSAPTISARVAQSVEHIVGNDEVSGPIPLGSCEEN